MSLDKLVVDCTRIFEKGQAYVALSRIKTLNGLYLRNFNPAKVMTDEKVVEFYKTLNIFNEDIKNIELDKNWKQAKNEQQVKAPSTTFNENALEYNVKKLRILY